LSLVAASAAQSAANVVQAGTKDITTKVREGGYDQKVNETVSVVAAKTTEIGSKTWGIMKGVVAMASQKVEAYAKEGGLPWNAGEYQRQSPNVVMNDANGGDYHEMRHGSSSDPWATSNNTSKHYSDSLGSGNNSFKGWDDWGDSPKSGIRNDSYTDKTVSKKPETGFVKGAKGETTGAGSDNWAGWDDIKDDDDKDDFFGGSGGRNADHTHGNNGNAGSFWTEAGFK
jgi:ADP-ribosylation factor GTPase-activating protein 1